MWCAFILTEATPFLICPLVMKAALKGHRDKVWKWYFLFMDLESRGLILRLDANKEAFNADGKCTFPFPF